jgi:hypothetical protein
MFVRLFCLDEIPSRRGRKIEMAVVVDLVENFGFECNPKDHVHLFLHSMTNLNRLHPYESHILPLSSSLSLDFHFRPPTTMATPPHC